MIIEPVSRPRIGAISRTVAVVLLFGLVLAYPDANGDRLFAADCREVYQVVAGDTLLDIAITRDSSVAAIATANGIDDPNLIFIDQQICIPARPTPTPNADGFVCNHLHRVERGENLEGLARQYDSPVSSIVDANPGRLRVMRENILKAGVTLCIP